MSIKKRISEVSYHLQALLDSSLFPEVEKGVESKDKDLLIETCKNAKIPNVYISTIVSILLSVGPAQKWIAPT